jgi:hypothetical protein
MTTTCGGSGTDIPPSSRNVPWRRHARRRSAAVRSFGPVPRVGAASDNPRRRLPERFNLRRASGEMRPTVLVVDDDPLVREFLYELLETGATPCVAPPTASTPCARSWPPRPTWS